MSRLAHMGMSSLLLVVAVGRPAAAQVEMGGHGSLKLGGVAYDFEVQICGEQIPGAYLLSGTGQSAAGQMYTVMVMRNELKEGRVEESVTLNNPQAHGASYFRDEEGWKRCTAFTLACGPGEGLPAGGPLLEFDGSTVRAAGLFIGPDTDEEGQPGTLTASCGSGEEEERPSEASP